ncbi:hypothetical protein FA95DRAFT_1555620 [Auriscalpium vulgare]|uniref:Uncharacterized protein n=1 Tax=Auriscalpium vulgare TaxID=40419 RepID=A0ACB8S409_9AGAM|nr:hypothetical protein FA95DRAFT_1555620 [Auriscalpium vulgare]
MLTRRTELELDVASPAPTWSSPVATAAGRSSPSSTRLFFRASDPSPSALSLSYERFSAADVSTSWSCVCKSHGAVAYASAGGAKRASAHADAGSWRGAEPAREPTRLACLDPETEGELPEARERARPRDREARGGSGRVVVGAGRDSVVRTVKESSMPIKQLFGCR